jgi:hypothetical protein
MTPRFAILPTRATPTARESILHTLAEMFACADRWTRARVPEGVAAAGG